MQTTFAQPPDNPHGQLRFVDPIAENLYVYFVQQAFYLLHPLIISCHLLLARDEVGPLVEGGSFRHVNTLHASDHQSKVPVPEFPPLRIKDLPMGFTKSDPDSLYRLVTSMVEGVRSSCGVIWNAFDYLEGSALKRIGDEFPIPNFALGPLHGHVSRTSTSTSSLLKQDRNCISWLDKQARGSVLYVSFGSLSETQEAELAETAWGLTNSEQPFLWVVRPGSVSGSDWVCLPNGFEEKTKGRGLVVKWAPQQEVLAHPAVGGFWTHSGWNSTLESICQGVPMICSPIFGDQRVNARYVDHVWKVGVLLDEGLERGAIEMAIRRLMVGKEGQEMRARIQDIKQHAEHCLREGGSSHESLERLKNYILNIE